MNLKLLITGSSGFIGTNLIKYFKFTSYEIISFSRNLGFNYNNFDYQYLNENLVDVVIHLAGKAHDITNENADNDYFKANSELTINIFNSFLHSNAQTFIYISSIKAVKDFTDEELTENTVPDPVSSYGRSKLSAENYILKHANLNNKRIFILRPCMIHGPGNKGNLNLLYEMICKGLPWPLGTFKNKRSFCSIDNLCFIINELIENNQISSGVYNIADDEPLSTNELIKLIAKSMDKKPFILNIPMFLVKGMSKLGDIFKLPLNTERLSKLTETYVVSNQKIKTAINKPLPVTSRYGLIKTFESFRNINTH
jgi:nucleoside-diphosphate-sugar epimerase